MEPAQPASEPPALEELEDGRDGGRGLQIPSACSFTLRPSRETTRIRKDQRNMDDRQPSTYFSPSCRAARCKTMQDGSRHQKTPGICKTLFYHTSARYVSTNLTKVRLFVKQQYHLPRCTSSTIRTASWRLHTTRAKGK